MFQPGRNIPPTSPMARMTLIILITINEDSCGLSPKPPHIRDQLIDLRFGEFLFESRHFVAAIANRIDRKSTRLNSSHQIISYAVLCLTRNRAAALSVHGSGYMIRSERCG